MAILNNFYWLLQFQAILVRHPLSLNLVSIKFANRNLNTDNN